MRAEETFQDDITMVSENEGTQGEITIIREAYAEKINAAISANDDKLAIELSKQFRDEAFETLFGDAAPSRRVA
jgi:hypothetical protein